MSSSSSDSDSDDFEPIRRIKINIKPKENVSTRDGADVEAIKASVEAWRPLGSRPHPSLSRRQSSLSSVSSLTFGGTGSIHGGSTNKTTKATDSSSANINTNQYYYQSSNFCNTKGNIIIGNHADNSMRSSPSCSSLVNEFTSRTSFSNFMPNASRTSSPLTFMSSQGSHSDTVPIALAIQESIELTVKGQEGPNLNGYDKRNFETRALGNIKVAFPNNFARLCSLDNATNSDPGTKQIPALKLRLHSTENIIRYYASGLVKDLDSERSSLSESVNTLGSNENNNNNNNESTIASGQRQNFQVDPFDLNESPTKVKSNSKIIEFDMDALIKHLKQLYEQSPNMRYYNVDVLRYQIAPIDRLEKCPLQVNAYWKLEPKLIKLRLDFRHSNQSGFNLERLREVSFSANMSNLVPPALIIQPVLPSQVSTLTRSSSVSTTTSDNNNSNIDLSDRHKNIPGTAGRSDSSYSTLNPCKEQGLGGNQLAKNDRSNKPFKNELVDLIDASPACENISAPLIPYSQLITPQQQQQPQQVPLLPPPPPPAQQDVSKQLQNLMQVRLPPPPSVGHSRHHNKTGTMTSNSSDTCGNQSGSFSRSASNSSSARSDILPFAAGVTGAPKSDQVASPTSHGIYLATYQAPLDFNGTTLSRPITQQAMHSVPDALSPSTPYITFEPQATWIDQTRQLTWKFDNLLAFYKNDGLGSLLAKLDFRHCNDVPAEFIERMASAEEIHQNPLVTPQPLDIKFMVVDSTLSKISLTIDSAGYRMSLLKREIRSGRYKTEPCIF